MRKIWSFEYVGGPLSECEMTSLSGYTWDSVLMYNTSEVPCWT